MKQNRRNFIKNTIKTGIGTSLLNTDYLRAVEPKNVKFPEIKVSSNPKKVVVGGAGLAGLCCAYELMKMGHDVTVLESSGRHGGHVFTVHDELSDGLYGDGGQEHITRPGYELYWHYIEEFGLTTLPYERRKNLLRNIDGTFYDQKELNDPSALTAMG